MASREAESPATPGSGRGLMGGEQAEAGHGAPGDLGRQSGQLLCRPCSRQSWPAGVGCPEQGCYLESSFLASLVPHPIPRKPLRPGLQRGSWSASHVQGQADPRSKALGTLGVRRLERPDLT